MGLTIPISYNIIWTGLNRTLKADNLINLGNKSVGPKIKDIPMSFLSVDVYVTMGALMA